MAIPIHFMFAEPFGYARTWLASCFLSMTALCLHVAFWPSQLLQMGYGLNSECGPCTWDFGAWPFVS